MEGNECYKFSTIKNFVTLTGAKEVAVAVDIGANVGEISLMLHRYFPSAAIFGFEAVTEYFESAVKRTKEIGQIKLSNVAVSAQQYFLDDFGEQPRGEKATLNILKALPEGGPGWIGGSIVLPSAHEHFKRPEKAAGYRKINQPVECIALDEFMKQQDVDEIDILKLDCEGCEHSVLGCAEVDTLRRIRFITGEYHDLARFSRVMQKKLFLTHKVNVIGQRDLGSFFAERLDGKGDGILLYDKTGMLIPRPWLAADPLDWHLFNEKFVLAEDRYWHSLS